MNVKKVNVKVTDRAVYKERQGVQNTHGSEILVVFIHTKATEK